jgi:hypothetical protein
MVIARIAGLVIVTLFSACGREAGVERSATDRVVPSVLAALPELTNQEARSIAEQSAVANGEDLERYGDPVVYFEASNVEPTWRITFQMKSPTPPGGHFTVLVADRTKKTTFMAGE